MEREFQVHRTERDYAQAEAWRWMLAFLIGVTMGVIGFLVDWGIGVLNNAKYFRTQEVITQGAIMSCLPSHAITSNSCLFFCRAALPIRTDAV